MPDEYMDSGGMGEESPEPKGEEKEEGATALIPKTLLAGKDFKPGDEVVFQIVHEYEDEVEIKYATEKHEEKPKETPPKSFDEEMDGLAAGNPKGY